jgi:hypothetical protein
MTDTLKIGAAALGGYFLGRTKKAKAAISLALWLSGRGRPRDIARDQAVRLLKTDRAQDLIGQMRGPILAVGKDAALALFESQAGRLSDNLQKRTDVLGDTVEGTGRKARGAIGGATGTASRLAERRRRATQPDEDEVDEGELAEDDEYADEDEAELAPADEAEEADEEDEADEADEAGDEDEYVDEDEDEYADEYEEGEPAEEDEEAEEGEEIDEGYVDETDEAEEPEETEEPEEEEVEEEPAPARRRSRQTASSSRSSRGGSARSTRGRSRRSVSA